MTKGGVCLSEDGGKTWRKSNSGMEETAATHILLDPASPVDARVVYVAGFGRGVYKSNDAAKPGLSRIRGSRKSSHLPGDWRWRQTGPCM